MEAYILANLNWPHWIYSQHHHQPRPIYFFDNLVNSSTHEMSFYDNLSHYTLILSKKFSWPYGIFYRSHFYFIFKHILLYSGIPLLWRHFMLTPANSHAILRYSDKPPQNTWHFIQTSANSLSVLGYCNLSWHQGVLSKPQSPQQLYFDILANLSWPHGFLCQPQQIHTLYFDILANLS